jgi:hypothetical protein
MVLFILNDQWDHLANRRKINGSVYVILNSMVVLVGACHIPFTLQAICTYSIAYVTNFLTNEGKFH